VNLAVRRLPERIRRVRAIIAAILGLVFVCLLAPCSRPTSEALSALVPNQDDAQARHFIDLVRLGDNAAVKATLDSTLPAAQVDDALGQIHQLLPQGESPMVDMVGCNIQRTFEGRVSDLLYQLHFTKKWMEVEVVLRSQDGATTITGFHFTPLADSLANLNRFTLTGKTQLNYLVLACCVAFPCLSLVALVACIRSRVRKKGLWILFILVGLTQFSLNWTTGAMSFQFLSVDLFSAGYFSSGAYGPWILKIGLPIGAILFLNARKRLSLPPVRTGSEV
jgi:hypothetical protein